jgi:DNA recombination protein RmuC
VEILWGAALGAGLCVALGLYLRARSEAGRAREVRGLETLSRDVARLAEIVSSDASRLGQRLEGIDSRLTQTQSSNGALSREIFDRLGDIGRAASSVAEQASQFSSLQDLLKVPQARGGLGEAMLEELLRQVLPPSSYAMQHRFSSGTVVDAVVRAGGRIACIDSKFPLANYRRICDSTDDADRAVAQRAFAADVDKHIRDISSRYIVPDEGTLDFAVMYVPAEGSMRRSCGSTIDAARCSRPPSSSASFPCLLSPCTRT